MTPPTRVTTDDPCPRNCGHPFGIHVLVAAFNDVRELIGRDDAGIIQCPRCDCRGTFGVAGPDHPNIIPPSEEKGPCSETEGPSPSSSTS